MHGQAVEHRRFDHGNSRSRVETAGYETQGHVDDACQKNQKLSGTRPPGLVKNEDDVAKQAGTDRLVLVREVKGCARSFR